MATNISKFITLNYTAKSSSSFKKEDWYEGFLYWLFEVRDIKIEDQEERYDSLLFFLRKNDLIEHYLYGQKALKAFQKSEKEAYPFPLPPIEGTTQKHREWGERIRLEFLKNTSNIALARFFYQKENLRIVDRAAFWVNLRKYSTKDIETIPFVISTLKRLSEEDSSNERARKNATLNLLNYLYDL